ncbi:glycogen/starch/alpha-glucan phosphorylase [Thiohalobacter thiocyanaticus]|uniref:Alpha-1,4 glucan phosphorylase n=1 Tax=Thiohalobacter thiocyanaticus TaxID=585455 RepID=A0A426QM95_9GAMM|nr:glycogen/starch/alpha-glucan phosphorylase [Thiohalobacter thiocyanaticus]RRQ22796.1 glycogen/starch/alpha-glucan phosphorylase [Thiohalobacter thiocyanaticus]
MTRNRANTLTVHPELTDLPPLAMDESAIDADFLRYFNRTLGRDKQHCTDHYLYEALAYAVRDRLMERWKATRAAYEKRNARRTCYLSLEFLMGRALGNAMLNLDITEPVRQVLQRYGLALEELAEAEHDAGLGNGGLGRLAACFLDSCATLQLPVLGYGLRYEYGMFRQEIVDGRQVEEPDHWLRDGHVWELERPEYTQRVHFGGRTEFYRDEKGRQRVRWVGTHDVLAVPYDVPVPGYGNDSVNSLRLWSATSTDEFDLDDFNAGDYDLAVESKYDAEHITMVLYPNDASENGKELRLRQQYFLASASLKDVLRRHLRLNGNDYEQLAGRNCFQLNDTHPSIAVAELMRLLVDEQRLDWDRAWGIVTRSMAYTNHTLLPEALEKWPVYLFERLLPRLLEIIYEINARFLGEVERRWPGDTDRLRRMSLIEEGETPMVRMAWLAIVGSFSVNGVAGLHSRLLTQGLFRDFFELWPEKFNNKTNGVTQRRWLAMCNPRLSRLISEHIGDGWVTDLAQLRQLETLADDADFQRRWREVKQANKQRLAALVRDEAGAVFSPDALFDIQVKRIHEYKRQLLNCLHVIHLYARIKRGDTADWTPRCVLIGGKAAPGYAMAKLIIRLITSVARLVNADPDVGDRLKLVFLPNYRVSSMELICPGADLSEQISTAGKEASGTGNMKFMMNGAITLGTYDGANIEILEELGEENFFRFGLDAEAVAATRADYRPQAFIEADPDLQAVMELLQGGRFNPYEPGLFDPLIQALTSPGDPWLTLADFRAYVDAQARAAAAYRDPARWTRMSILNTARSGRFSTDRTMQEYNRDIWKLEAVPPEAL